MLKLHKKCHDFFYKGYGDARTIKLDALRHCISDPDRDCLLAVMPVVRRYAELQDAIEVSRLIKLDPQILVKDYELAQGELMQCIAGESTFEVVQMVEKYIAETDNEQDKKALLTSMFDDQRVLEKWCEKYPDPTDKMKHFLLYLLANGRAAVIFKNLKRNYVKGTIGPALSRYYREHLSEFTAQMHVALLERVTFSIDMLQENDEVNNDGFVNADIIEQLVFAIGIDHRVLEKFAPRSFKQFLCRHMHRFVEAGKVFSTKTYELFSQEELTLLMAKPADMAVLDYVRFLATLLCEDFTSFNARESEAVIPYLQQYKQQLAELKKEPKVVVLEK